MQRKQMLKLLIQCLLIPLMLGACINSSDKSTSDLSMAVIQTTPKNIDLEVDTSKIKQGRPTQTIIFTNIGRQPVTGLKIKGFKEESAPLEQVGTCDKNLAVGGSCELKIKLTTSHKFASSAPVSRATFMTYEYNDGSEKKVEKISVKYRVEKWVASVFLTNASTTGQIEYARPDDLPIIKAGADSADYYCNVDKNNPHNGYQYKALIYDTTQRTPYLNWVLYGGYTYFSVMPDVYHQKVWQTSYKQGTAHNILAKAYNCIGKDCTKQTSGEEAAWSGLQLNGDDSMNMSTCGTAGNAWKSDKNKFNGMTFAIQALGNFHSMTMQHDIASCDMHKKIICVSM